MRILYLTAQLPEPPHAGGPLRTSGLLRGVHAAGHEVHLLAFATLDQWATHHETLKAFCTQAQTIEPNRRPFYRRLYDLFLTQRADMQGRCNSPAFARRLAQVLAGQPFDLIQLESLEMAVYLPVIRRIQPDTPVIYDSFNAEFAMQHSVYQAELRSLVRLPGALYSLAQWRRLRRFERQVCQAVTHVIAVSDADARLFHELAPGCAVSIVPNGIDVSSYQTEDHSLDLGANALVFTGSMSYRPNVDAALWFADQVLGKVRAQVPDTKFFVVGNQPHLRLNPLREREGIEITGWIPDVNPFLHAAAVYVAPLRMGSGTRLKLLQAMATRRAVVSTSIGALGIDVQPGVELILADTAADFAQAVITLLQDPARRHCLGQAAGHFVETHYDWSVIVPRLLTVYDHIKRSHSELSRAKEQKV